MNIVRKIAVIGGDMRSLYCAEAFAKNGFECAVFGFDKEPLQFPVRAAQAADALNESTAVVLPLPTSDGESGNIFSPFSDTSLSLSELNALIPRDAAVFAGNPTERDIKYLSDHTVENYAQDEGFMLRGRIPTAEGALQIAMEQTAETIFGSNVLICGGGRIGRYLADILSSMGAKVTLSVRKRTDRILAAQNGLSVIDTAQIADFPVAFNLIFNTVPSRILNEKVLKKLRGKPLIIELASKPYGADFTPLYRKSIRKFFVLFTIDFRRYPCYNRKSTAHYFEQPKRSCIS